MGIVQCVDSAILIFLGTLIACIMPTIYLSVPLFLPITVGLTLSIGTMLLVHHLARGADHIVIIRAAAAIFLVILCEIMLVNCVKVFWGRPRMRLVASNTEACFLPWWQMGGALKDSLIAAGVASEEFKSFPSGHTANATVMLLLGLIPYLKPQLQKFRNLFLAIGFTWAGVVAFTRIVMGAHYLTDTSCRVCDQFALCVRYLHSNVSAYKDMTVFFIRYRSQKPLRLIRVVSRKGFFADILQD